MTIHVTWVRLSNITQMKVGIEETHEQSELQTPSRFVLRDFKAEFDPIVKRVQDV